MTNRKLGDILLAEGIVTPLQLSIALAAQQTSSRRLGEILVERGFATERQIAETLAAQYDYPLADLATLRPQANALSLVNADLALEHAVLPVRIEGDVLEIVLGDPLDVLATDAVIQTTHRKVSVSLAPRSELLAQIRKTYGLDEAIGSDLSEVHLPHRFVDVVPRRKVGEVLLFDAVDETLGRRVTLSAVPVGSDADNVQRRLVRSAAQSPSRWVSAIHDAFEFDGQSWTVFERLDGESLAHVLRTRGRRTLSQSAELVAQIAEGVDQLHREGGYTGLICPENILVRAGGSLLTPFTEPSFEYTAPEMQLGHQGTPASDVFALGTLLWECNAGENPHRAEAERTGDRSPWGDPMYIENEVPAALVEVLTNCMSQEPNERFASAILVANSLRAYNWAAAQSIRHVIEAGDRDELLVAIGDEVEERRGFWGRLFGRRQAA